MNQYFLFRIQKKLQRTSKIALFAILIDGIWGEPQLIYKIIPHPIIWIGNLISLGDRTFNHRRKSVINLKYKGILTTAILVFITTTLGYKVQRLIFQIFPRPIAYLINAVLMSVFIAQRSLYEHVMDIQQDLQKNNIKQARQNLSKIVGRNTNNLDEASICRAAIESLSENFSDGVTAPILWGCLAGLPGIVFYKTINTADSMIGHLNQKYRDFGYGAAKLDDFANLAASRIAASYLLLSARQLTIKNLKWIRHEAKKHNSPNAGWPEAAMAKCLSISLAGPRTYQDLKVDGPWIGQGTGQIQVSHIENAVKLYIRSCKYQFLSLLIMILINLNFDKSS